VELENNNNVLQNERDEIILDYNNLKNDYEKLLAKSKILPDKPEDYIELALKLEKSGGLIKHQILIINYLQTKNSFIKALKNMHECFKITDEYNEEFSKYLQAIISFERNYLINCNNLNVKLLTNQISKANYDKELNDLAQSYNSETTKLTEEYSNKIKSINEIYASKIDEIYNINYQEVNSSNKEADDRLEELFEIFKGLYKDYEINEIYINDEDLEVFGVKELIDKYKEEIENLNYPINDN